MICTSLSLRASPRVSSGFAPFRHSSLSFESRQSPVDSHRCQTPWSVFQDGSNGEPTGQHPERLDIEARQRRALPTIIRETAFHGRIESPGFGLPPNPRWSTPRVDRRTGSSPFHIRPGHIDSSHPLPIQFPSADFPTLCTQSNYQIHRARYYYLFMVTNSPCQDWVICAPASFLRCGSRFSGSLSGIEP
uniref:CHK1 checkpoint n=1 Tax=Solanum tuberosum TaxID=4113 RepID=M1CYV8_SOLTU